MARTWRHKLTITALVVYWPIIFTLAHIPIPQLIQQAGLSDKGLHFIVYLILSFLLWFSVRPENKINWRKATAWWVLLATLGYGGLDEIVQGFIGRNCDIFDFLADVKGVTVGLILASFFSFWPGLLAVTGITIFSLTNIAKTNIADLLPVANTILQPAAYMVFTLLWIKNINHHLSAKAPQVKWLIAALAGPTGLLAITKLFSVISGRFFEVRLVAIAVAGIAAVVLVFYFVSLSRRIRADQATGDKRL